MSNQPNRLPGAPNYGRIARVYRWLEYLAFGRALQKSRETFLDQLIGCQKIAVFGGGDGRCFEPILKNNSEAMIDAFDIDAVMIGFARKRLQAVPHGSQVTFRQVDARTAEFKRHAYDAVVTQYFLDCFDEAELEQLIPRIAESLRPGGLWLFSDFAIPGRPGPARWRAQITIALLCLFFRWQVQHPLRSLPPMESKLAAHGFLPCAVKERSGRMVKTVLYRRAPGYVPRPSRSREP